MNSSEWQVEWTDTASERARNWDVPPKIRIDVSRHVLTVLSTVQAHAIGREIVAPIRAHIMELVWPPGHPAYKFIFWVNVAKNPGTRYVVDAECKPYAVSA